MPSSARIWTARPRPFGQGERMYEVLKQEQYKPMPVEEQAVSLYVAVNGYLDSIAVADVVRFERELLEFLRKERPALWQNSGRRRSSRKRSRKN